MARVYDIKTPTTVEQDTNKHFSMTVHYDSFQCMWHGMLRSDGNVLRAFGLSRDEVCWQLLQQVESYRRLKNAA
jgi:hypothetical protein